MKTLLAFHNDRAVQAKYLTRVRDHRKADQLLQGDSYWKDGKGCAVGCTLHSSDHGAYETELGIPRILARLEDGIFEGLDKKLARTWPERFLAAPAVGADLSMVWPKFAHWMLVDPQDGVVKFAKTDGIRKAIVNVAELYADWVLSGVCPPAAKWRAVQKKAAAYAVYAAAAYAYASAYAAYAAYAAAYAAAVAAYAAYDDAAAYDAYDDAAAAAYDDAAAYAYDDARKKFFALASEKLLQLMSEAPAVAIG